MNRRSLLATVLTLPFAAKAKAANPWSTELWDGGKNQDSYVAALHIRLDRGWKTYWRVPGEAGIPPQIKVEGDNVASFTIDYPLPSRIVDDSGEALGYHDEIAFVLHITPKDQTNPIEANVSAFFGVCETVCRPVKFSSHVKLGQGAPASHAADIAKWQALVPKPDQFVSDAMAEDGYLLLTLTKPVDDIFVDGPEQYYFRKPEFNGTIAKLKIDGLKAGQKLMGVDLRLTATAKGMGLEQKVMVA